MNEGRVVSEPGTRLQARWALASPACALGLGLAAATACRSHALLAGLFPRPGLLVAAGLLLGACAMTSAVREGRRLAWVVALLVLAFAAFLLPVAQARLSGWPAAILTAVTLAFAAAACARAGLVAPSPSTAAWVSSGTLVAALALPFVGPLPCALAALALVLVSGLLPEPAGLVVDAPVATAGRRSLHWILAGIGAGWALAALAFVAAKLDQPWPHAFLVAGLVGAACALGLRWSRARAPAPWLGIVAGLALLVVAVAVPSAAWQRLDAPVIAAMGRHALSPAGGLLALVPSVLVVAILGLLVGLMLLPRPVTGASVDRTLDTSLAGGLAAGLVSAGLACVLLAMGMSAAGRHRAAWRAEESPGAHPSDLLVDGRPVMRRGVERKPDDVLSGLLGGLLADSPARVVFVGWPSADATGAARAAGATQVTWAVPSRAASHLAGPAQADAIVTSASPASLGAPGSADVVVNELDDPSHPAFEAWFTPQAVRAVADVLAPGGAYVQRLSLERLGPEEILREVARIRQVFPGAVLASADRGHGGSLLVVARQGDVPPEADLPAIDAQGGQAPGGSPAAAPGAETLPPRLERAHEEPAPGASSAATGASGPGAPAATDSSEAAPGVPATAGNRKASGLPLDRLTGARMTPQVLAALRGGLVLGPNALLDCFVAGPRDLDALTGDEVAADPWRPGGWAFRRVPPPELAVDMDRAFFYDHLAVAEIPFDVEPAKQSGAWSESWPFVGVETRLGPEWSHGSGRLRFRNTLTSYLGVTGVWRDQSRRLALGPAEERIDVVAQEQQSSALALLVASIESFWPGRVERQGRALVHGHAALWAFAQPSVDEQIVVVTWHCPVEGRLYVARLDLAHDVRPMEYAGAIQSLLSRVRCRHERDSPSAASQPPEADEDHAIQETTESAAASGVRP